MVPVIFVRSYFDHEGLRCDTDRGSMDHCVIYDYVSLLPNRTLAANAFKCNCHLQWLIDLLASDTPLQGIGIVSCQFENGTSHNLQDYTTFTECPGKR